jgi:hypothetical protein
MHANQHTVRNEMQVLEHRAPLPTFVPVGCTGCADVYIQK